MGKHKICLSPSSQTGNAYAAGGTSEATQCGRIAEFCKAALERCGFDVIITHLDTLAQKCDKSNSFGAELHIPIHSNSCDGKATGTRMFCGSFGSEGHRACKAIFDYLAPLTPGTSENIKEYPTLYEIRNVTAWTAYVEVDFHDVPAVAEWIIAHPDEIGEAITRGACDYFGVDYVVDGAPVKAAPMYRVRQTWENAKSQIGAYRDVENAKAACPGGYSVFDADGNSVYSSAKLPPADPFVFTIADIPPNMAGIKPEVQALIDCGALKGTAPGEINLPLSAVRALVIMARYINQK